MLRFTFSYIAGAFQAPMAMDSKPGSWRNSVFIDDTEHSKLHVVCAVLIFGKERHMVRLQSAMVGVFCVFGVLDGQPIGAPTRTYVSR